MITKTKRFEINFDEKLKQCTLSGTNYFYTDFVC